jgi:hypothetical protein
MKRSCLAVAVTLAVAAVSFSSTSAQTRAMPKTPWGEPDLQGTWTNETITPFERPAEMAGKAFLTEAEAAAVEKSSATRRDKADEAPLPAGQVGTYNQFWLDSGTKVVKTRRTSLVVAPEDGRVPVTPEAMERRRIREAQVNDDPAFISPWDRCITRGVPGGFFPAGYNNAYQIVQTPGYVMIHYEMIHYARVIPTNGRPHLPSHVRLWDGDSVGRWEGNTLVVDIANYNGKGWIATNGAAGRIRGVEQSDALHVVERFTLTDQNTIDYQVTIEDQKVYSKPWTVSIPLIRDESYQVFEYACHEGNSAIEHILRGGRDEDRRRAAGATPQNQ